MTNTVDGISWGKKKNKCEEEEREVENLKEEELGRVDCESRNFREKRKWRKFFPWVNCL